MFDHEWQKLTIFIILAAIIFNFIAKWILSKLHKHFEKQHSIWKDSFVQALYLPLSIFIWVLAIAYACNLLLSKFIPEFSLENIPIILTVAGILCVAWFAFRWKRIIVQLSIDKSKRRESSFDAGKIDVVDKIITLLIGFITILLLLEVTGHSMTTLIAFGGIGGLALAFSSQEIISNCFGGLMIYTTRLFSIGDWINIPEKSIEGHVEEIGWYMTRIRTFAKRPMYVPNSIFAKSVVETPSRMSHRRFKETIHLRYSDIKAVKEIIADITNLLHENPHVDHNQSISVYVDEFGTFSLDIVVSAYTLTAIESESYAQAKQEILLAILDVLEKHGAKIAIPYEHG